MSKATKNVPPSKSPESRKQRRIIRNLFKAQNALIAAEEDGDTEAAEYFSARAEHLESQLAAMELEIRTPRVKKADDAEKPAGVSAKAQRKSMKRSKIEDDNQEDVYAQSETADVLEEVDAAA